MPPGASDDLPTPGARARPTWTTRPGWRAPRTRRTRTTLVLGGLVLAAVLSTRWVRLNGSPSVPRGVYRLADVAPPLARGTLVVLPVPVSVQPWHSRWMPLLKPVAAIAGDVVCVQDLGLWINGELYGLVWRDAEGKPLPQWTGCLIVQDGTVFLASRAPNSLDGRYWGLTPVAHLTAQAIPLVTWR